MGCPDLGFCVCINTYSCAYVLYMLLLSYLTFFISNVRDELKALHCITVRGIVGLIPTDLSYSSHSALVPYRTMRPYVAEVCTGAHFCWKAGHCVTFVWCIVGFVRCIPKVVHWLRVPICPSNINYVASWRYNYFLVIVYSSSEFLIKLGFCLSKTEFKMLSAKWQQFCSGFHVLKSSIIWTLDISRLYMIR